MSHSAMTDLSGTLYLTILELALWVTVDFICLRKNVCMMSLMRVYLGILVILPLQV